MTSLYEELHNSEVETADPGGPAPTRFIPQNSLEKILTESAIKQALAKAEPAEYFFKRPELTQSILEGGKKLFSVLILIKRKDAISRFLENDQLQDLDSRLPFKLDEDLRAILGNQDDAARFYEVQWKVIPPILRHDRSHRVFHQMTVLPFVQCETLKSGGFGTISRVTLHPSHQLLVTPDLDGRAIVIRKRIVSTGSNIAENEERILSSLRVLKHQNIIALLASYSYQGAHYFLFPPADGDLQALLDGQLRLPPNVHKHTILRELHGLSSAIETVHEFFVGEYNLTMIGCHHDLKPKNILVKGRKFILTDFGLSRLKSTVTGLPNEKSRVEGYFYAPECQPILEGSVESTAGPEADVWSFGCILAMIITFLQYGSDGVKTFEDSRKIKVKYFTTRSFHANGQLNPAVLKWLEKIDTDPEAGCLRGIKWLILQQLNIDPTKRPRMPTVTENLFFLSQKGVFEFSCKKFQKLLDQASQQSPHQRIRLEIERKRYLSWGEVAGFTREHGEGQKVTVTNFRKFSSEIIKALAEIEDELHAIDSWGTHSLKPTYFRLKTLNERLYAYLPPQLVDEGKRLLESAMLDGTTTTNLRNISDALQNDMSPEYKAISALAEIKQHFTTEIDTNAIEINPDDTNPDGHDGLLLRDSDISIDMPFHSHSLGTVSSEDGREPVLIEWVMYGPLHARVSKIAKLFSNPIKVECSGLRVLPCKGYYKDGPRSRYGLVYRVPTLNPSPMTLRQLIKSTNERSKRPALGDMFELARKIVHCVLEVHKVGWLHRGISSYNIIFFPSAPSEPIPVTSPYLIGFSHSRRNENQTFTAGASDESQREYYHPDYLRDERGFRPQHDFYSVGLVLLEIGRWRPLSQLTRRLSRWNLEARLEALVKECVDNLPNAMGADYCEAVTACLTTDFSTRHGGDGVRNEFETKVMNRLAKCQA